ncbi:hypothetical protein GWK47_051848 [Chionoecetes opilio]|uniref:Uncharacterized protein n=1 Tax=Chionoecetes opilio TaxID=41210 RepID=A0A8J5CQG8_CHIOP|nr:hypothetical protein GWK47_051848 [Chionoecetes opilio]
MPYPLSFPPHERIEEDEEEEQQQQPAPRRGQGKKKADAARSGWSLPDQRSRIWWGLQSNTYLWPAVPRLPQKKACGDEGPGAGISLKHTARTVEKRQGLVPFPLMSRTPFVNLPVSPSPDAPDVPGHSTPMTPGKPTSWRHGGAASGGGAGLNPP